MLQRDAIGCIFLEFRVVELIPRKNNQLGAILTLLKSPARIGYLIFQKLVEGGTFNVDSLFHTHKPNTSEHEKPKDCEYVYLQICVQLWEAAT